MTSIEDAPTTTDIPLFVDGVEMSARPGELLIAAAERHGVYIPRFCYHERMRSVGMCRMCLVEVDTGRGPTLQPACMLPATPDMKVDTQSDVVVKAQDGVLEFLLINHPLDCPVCDKGGECPLQDQTLAYGPGESRFVEEKRHFEKPIAISDTVFLDRERCILCDRCTRFAAEVAGDPLIHFMDRGGQTQVNTFPDDPFASYWSGNTVQICPVGALTAVPYRFKARPWDLEEVESTCVTTPTGDGIVIQASRNEVLRYLGRDVDAVNWGWLSDKDRFGFEAISHEHRVTAPLVRGDGLGRPSAGGTELVATRWAAALAEVADTIRTGLERGGPASVAVIGGARLTNEAQYAWARLAKGVIGTDNVDAQLGDGLPADSLFRLPRVTIDDACEPGGTIVALGPDVKEGFGALYLRLRHAITNDKVALIELGPRASGLAPLAAVSLVCAPGREAEVAAALVADSPATRAVGGVDPTLLGRAAEILAGTGPVTVIAGRPSAAQRPELAVAALDALAHRPGGVRFLSALRRANVHGALDMGLTPGWLPGRVRLGDGAEPWGAVWATVPTAGGLDTEGILRAAADGRIDTLILLGADPVADFSDRDLAERGLDGARRLVAVDLFLTESSRRAHVVLPAAGPAEVDGTFTNLEGRISLVNAKVTPPGTAWPDWMIACELAVGLGHPLELATVDDVWTEVVAHSPLHRGVDRPALAAAPEGIVVTAAPVAPDGSGPVLSLPTREQWSHRVVATHRLYDQGTLVQHCPASAGLAPGAVIALAPGDFAALGLVAGDRVRITSARDSITAPVMSEAGLAKGSVGLWINQIDGEPNRLIDAAALVTDVRVETI